jgi:pterin-4a-carbinolamine dehydratase
MLSRKDSPAPYPPLSRPAATPPARASRLKSERVEGRAARAAPAHRKAARRAAGRPAAGEAPPRRRFRPPQGWNRAGAHRAIERTFRFDSPARALTFVDLVRVLARIGKTEPGIEADGRLVRLTLRTGSPHTGGRIAEARGLIRALAFLIRRSPALRRAAEAAARTRQARPAAGRGEARA